jgi:hypothetical protein
MPSNRKCRPENMPHGSTSLLRSTQIASDPSHTNQTGAPVQALQRILGMRPDWERRPRAQPSALAIPLCPQRRWLGLSAARLHDLTRPSAVNYAGNDSTRSSHDKNHDAESN